MGPRPGTRSRSMALSATSAQSSVANMLAGSQPSNVDAPPLNVSTAPNPAGVPTRRQSARLRTAVPVTETSKGPGCGKPLPKKAKSPADAATSEFPLTVPEPTVTDREIRNKKKNSNVSMQRNWPKLLQQKSKRKLWPRIMRNC
jgi:hypothetical protein